MKHVGIKLIALCSLLLLSAMSASADIDVRVRTHFSELNSYGEWVHIGGYGTVWRPDADRDWRPFMYGHWVDSEDGWLWVSDEPFGWIVSHYGNWFFDDYEGWVWVPGYDWSPARVQWHVTDDEIGWAPLLPPPLPNRVRVSMSVPFFFAPAPMFISPEIRTHITVRSQPVRNASVRVYVGPPSVELVRRVAPQPIVRVRVNKVRITTSDRPLIRVEAVGRTRTSVEVPIGPRYRRVSVRSEPQPSTTVRVNTQPSTTVRVYTQPTAKVRVPVTQIETRSERVVVEPRRSTKTRVEVRTKNDDDDDHEEDQGKTRKRVRVQD